jgi:membrane protein implicated in regulation of membrane protease activity
MFWIWVVLAASFIIGEIFTAGFYLFPFAVGTGIAAILTLFGLPSWLQWLTFIVVSSVLVIFSRRLAEKLTKEPPEKVGAERLVGHVGLLIEAIDPVTDSGRVRVKKDEWRATSADGSKIDTHTEVRVLKVEGAHLVVERAEGQR